MSYLKTFILDKLFNSINNKQFPLLVKISNISSMHPTLFVYSQLCGLWVVEITCKLIFNRNITHNLMGNRSNCLKHIKWKPKKVSHLYQAERTYPLHVGHQLGKSDKPILYRKPGCLRESLWCVYGMHKCYRYLQNWSIRRLP